VPDRYKLYRTPRLTRGFRIQKSRLQVRNGFESLFGYYDMLMTILSMDAPGATIGKTIVS
jgi:hypothetical protein